MIEVLKRPLNPKTLYRIPICPCFLNLECNDEFRLLGEFKKDFKINLKHYWLKKFTLKINVEFNFFFLIVNQSFIE